jgi:hypothetical protein
MSHTSTEDLARFAAGDLRPRKAARIASHLAGCDTCDEQLQRLAAVPGLLAAVQFPQIPAHLSSRIDMALASESAARVARQPASEAGRRDLPARARPARGWRLPGLTAPGALRTMAATGAAALVAGGGYVIVSHLGGGAAGTANSGSIRNVPAHSRSGAGYSTGQLTFGPDMTYQRHGHAHTFPAVESNTDFQPDTLAAEATKALTVARITKGVLSGRTSAAPTTNTPASAPAAGTPATGAPQAGPGTFSLSHGTVTRLQGCVGLVAGGRNVLLVDLAKYQGQKATIIIVAVPAGRPEVFAVGARCSASDKDILASQQLPRA